MSVDHEVPGICFGDEYDVLLFCPNCPVVLLPHIHNVPSVFVDMHDFWPLSTAVHVVPGTCFGDEYSVVLLCPNCPSSLCPHVHSVPSVLIAAPPYQLPWANLLHVVPGTWTGDD